MRLKFISTIITLCIAVTTVAAQTPEFTYQGRLVSGSAPANSPHDFEFRLCASDADCAAPLEIKQRFGVPVANGVFSVKLDFDPSHFTGADRWLEISVRPAGGSTFATLSPRQRVTSAPYSIKSLNSENALTAANATQLGGVDASQYVITTDPRMTDDRSPRPNSPNYIRNSNEIQSGGFNIDGNGTVGGILSARNASITGDATVPTLALTGVQPAPVAGSNGTNAAPALTIVGAKGGNASGGSGGGGGSVQIQGGEGGTSSLAGGDGGSIVLNPGNGWAAGGPTGGRSGNVILAPTNGTVVIGAETGSTFTSLRVQARSANRAIATFGDVGSFSVDAPGVIGGRLMLTNDGKVGIGTALPSERLHLVGNALLTGNVMFSLGNFAGVPVYSGLSPAGGVSIGVNSGFEGPRNTSLPGLSVRTSLALPDSGIFFTRTAPDGALINLMRMTENGLLGVGTSSPATRLHVSGAGIVRTRINSDLNAGVALTLNDQPGWSVATVSGGQFQIFNDAVGQNAVWIDSATNNVGIGTSSPAYKLDVNGTIRGTNVAPSDLRFKRNIKPLTSPIDKIRLLRGVSYNWRSNEFPQMNFSAGRSMGFIAQEVERVLPELVSRDEKGFLSLAYSEMLPVIVEAVKEQQTQIENQRRRIESQQRQIDALRNLVCESKQESAVCKEEQK